MRNFAIGLASACLAGAAAPASAATFAYDAQVAAVAGENLGEGFAPSILPGAPVSLNLNIDPSFDLADVFDLSPFQVSISFGGAVNALVQTCCINMTELDPTDGEISIGGFLAGLTGASFGDYQGFASRFSLTFRVAPGDAPASAFATTDDLVAFFAIASLTVEGFVEGQFVDQVMDRPDFRQQIYFAPVPLPGAMLFFLSGAAGLFASRLKRAPRARA